MAKPTAEQKRARALARARREALEWEERDRRSREQAELWKREGTYLTYEEYQAGEPCRGCGEPLLDRAGPGRTNMVDAESIALKEQDEERYRQRHGACRSHRWTVEGSMTLHCGHCCPPPPMSPGQIERVRQIFAPSGGRKPDLRELDDWDQTLTCGHVVKVRVHRSNHRPSLAVADCGECGERRGIVESVRIGPSNDPEGHIKRERLNADLRAAQAKLERQRKAAEKTEQLIEQLSAQLGDGPSE